MSKILDIARLAADVRTVAKKRPDHIQEVCAFFSQTYDEITGRPTGKFRPSCIIGQGLALQNIGQDDVEGDGYVNDLYSGLKVINSDPATKAWLETVQHYADRRNAWGHAVELADSPQLTTGG